MNTVKTASRTGRGNWRNKAACWVMIRSLEGVKMNEERTVTKDRRYRIPPLVEALCEIHLRDSAWDDTVPGQF